MRTIYLSGKMTGLDDYGKSEFEKAENFLNYILPYDKILINPYRLAEAYSIATNRPIDSIDRVEYLKFDIKVLMNCTDIMMLPNYKESNGALLELSNSMEFGIKEGLLTESMLEDADRIEKIIGENMFKTELDIVEMDEGTLKIKETLTDILLPYYLTGMKDSKLNINDKTYKIVAGSVNMDTLTQKLKVIEIKEETVKTTLDVIADFNKFYADLEKERADFEKEKPLWNNRKIEKSINKFALKMADDYNMNIIDDIEDPYYYFEKKLNKFVGRLIRKGVIN